MSFEKKSQEPTLEDELRAIPYHNLRAEFKKRGIESEWTPGTKKEDLIKRALDKLGVIKEVTEKVEESVDESITEEDKQELIIVEVDKIEKAKEAEVEEVISEEVREMNERTEALRKKFSKDGKLQLEELIQAKAGALRSLRTAKHDKRKRKRRLQSCTIYDNLILEARKQ